MILHTTDRPFLIRKWMDFFEYDGLSTVWNTIYYASEVLMNNERLRRHEGKHIEQMEMDGKVLWLVKYNYYWIRYGYKNNPYEIEAREAETA